MAARRFANPTLFAHHYCFVCAADDHLLPSFLFANLLIGELHGKAWENRAAEGKTWDSDAWHGRRQYHFHGGSGIGPQRQVATSRVIDAARNDSSWQTNGWALAAGEKVCAAGGFEGSDVRRLGHFQGQCVPVRGERRSVESA